jgi:hypothetical protein
MRAEIAVSVGKRLLAGAILTAGILGTFSVQANAATVVQPVSASAQQHHASLLDPRREYAGRYFSRQACVDDAEFYVGHLKADDFQCEEIVDEQGRPEYWNLWLIYY